MNADAPLCRIATFRARRGGADRLAEQLLQAATLVAEAPGCDHWLVHRDDDRLQLRSLDAVRVAPGSVRELLAGDEGLEVLAFGVHSPGDGEMVIDRPAR